jgi:hypothetical protein
MAQCSRKCHLLPPFSLKQAVFADYVGFSRCRMIWHPESSGRAHIVGMIDKFIAKLVARSQAAEDGEITFETMEDVAHGWKHRG